MIRVFRHGRNTNTILLFEDGISKSSITRPGKGLLLEIIFPTVHEAEFFCQQELKKNPSQVFYLLNDDIIIGTVLDSKFHQDKEKRWRRVYGALSMSFFTFVGFEMSLAYFPNLFYAQLALTLGIGAFYALLLLITGAGNFEGAVCMVVLLIFLGVALPGIARLLKQNQQSGQTTSDLKAK
jgi:hypothetical protein